MRHFFLFTGLLLSVCLQAQNLQTRFERSQGTESPPYEEIISWWQQLDAQSNKVKLLTMGMTDAGLPLHLVVISGNGDYQFDKIRRQDRRIILVNNGIHPGEPDGIDASMLLARDIATGKYKLPENVVLAIIPVYNIGGCLNRTPWYRIDQNGPAEKGSRGNSENLDLNRDFIKCDSREARSFASIFHLTDPDVFVDNHVSNGADYQHVMTLLTTQHNKLAAPMGDFMEQQFEPALYTTMQQKGFDLVPYVNSFGDTPENGWPAFWDSPRYSSGYAALWHCFSFTPETHMLKPYDQRVKATYALMQSFIDFTSAHSIAIRDLRKQARQADQVAATFPISWSQDTVAFKEITYKGYQSGRKPSGISGLPRLYYDRSKPYEKKVKFFNRYTVSTEVKKPTAYIIPQGWWKVTELLQLNKVQMIRLIRDTVLEVEAYHIDDYKASARPYEMHHPNTDVKVSASLQKIRFRKGDWYIPMDQPANRFLIATLEPQGEDSYFAWNFFDAVLAQKEGYSDYVFEDIAAAYLKSSPDLQDQLQRRKAADTAFAQSARAQLRFVYEHSPYAEPGYLRYPVYRLVR